MSQAYTPGLTVARRVRHRVRRSLPLTGEVLVAVGARVAARDVVARTHLPGDVTPLNLANLLSLTPADLPRCMLKQVGERVAVGEPLARTPGMFGMFRREHLSKIAGTIETVSAVTGQVLIRGEPVPVEVTAYVAGEVVQVLPGEGVVVETQASLVQGIFGIGGETCGPLRPVCDDPAQELGPDRIGPDLKGAVIVGGARTTGAAVRKAIEVGAAAIVSGGMDDQDLRDVLGYDLGVAITGSERVGVTLVITEGFGEIAMAGRTFDLLRSLAGREASVDGATQIRAGVMRPEVVVPVDPSAAGGGAPVDEESPGGGRLEVGAEVRIIRDPWFGRLGTVTALPPELRELASGSKARVLEVSLASGERAVVPRANVEMYRA